MPDLAATSPAPRVARDERRRTLAATGALLGAVIWLEALALGFPRILLSEPAGYALIPVSVVVGALVGLTPVRRLMWIVVAALAVCVSTVAYTPVMRPATAALVRADSLGARPVQAVVSLSAGILSDGHLRPAATDRLLTALSLVRRGVASTLILSRERSRDPADGVTSDDDQRRLIALLERPLRVLVVDSVFSTRDEARRMRALARPLGITSVAVVTSPLHTRRACAAFEKVGFVVTCVPSESREVALRNLRRAPDRVRACQLWLYELAGRAVYRARGWI